jgi:hypothetical protein
MNQMKKINYGSFKKASGAVILLLVTLHTGAQNNTLDKISIASPTAASLGKYADIPVNYHTGLPGVSIPIYTVKAGSLSLPISLSYHASGIKVQELSSWVGAGWSLNAGGVITRSVKGGPDERNTNMGSTEEKGHFSNYGYNNYLSGEGQQQNWKSFADGKKDGEPDLFIFNFAGYSGKFYFRDDRTPILVPQQDLKIEYYYPGDTASSGTQSSWNIQAFTITTPDGDKYYFGNSPGWSGTAPAEITNTVTDNGGISGSAIISSWYLNKITTADNQFAINFTYASENYGFFTTGMFPLAGDNTADYEYNLVKNNVAGVRLSQISFPGGNVNFNTGAVRTDLSSGVTWHSDTVNQSATTLGSIQITNGGTLCKKYKFSYSYFADSTSSLTGYFHSTGYDITINTDRYRLRLDTLREISCDSSILIKPHIFTYFTEQVPRMLSFGIDHWGFNNGVTTNQKLIPTYTVYDGTNRIQYSGANRDASWPAMRAGSLEKITYPTGGYTQFVFEPHDIYTSFSNYEATTRLGMSMGFDGNSTPDTSSLVADGNAMLLAVNNVNGYYDAQLIIKNGGGTVVYNSGFIAAGTLYNTSVSLSAATYQVILTIATGGNSNPSGKGVIATFYQWATVEVSGNATVGGLRIKTITHNDGITTTNMVTSYTYTATGTQSAGILYSKPTYVQMLRNDLIRDLGYYSYADSGFIPYTAGENGCLSTGFYYKSPSSIRPMGITQGNHIGYSQVKVSQPGHGHSIYSYYPDNSGTFITNTQNSDVAIRSVATTYCDPDLPNYPAAPLPFDSKRGELYYELHYDNVGSLLKDTYYYPVFSNNNDSAVQTPAFAITALSVTGVTKYLGTFYKIGTIHKSSILTVATDYSSGNSVVTTAKTEFNSPWHTQATRKYVLNSTGDSLISKMKYAFDFRISTCDSISTGVSSYPSACTTCLSTYNSARTACGSTASCLATAYLAYAQCLTDARVNWVSLRRSNFTNASNVFATNRLSAKNNADGELKPILQLQDEYDNALIEKTDWKNSNLLSAGFTHYDYMANPSGFVYPQKARIIDLLVPSASFTLTGTSSNDQSVVADSRYSDLSSFAFNYANLAHITKRDAVTESYLWDYSNQYPVAKADNATEAQIAFSSFESDGKGNWDYTSGGVRSDSGSVTGTKAYTLVTSNIQRTALDSSKTYMLTYWVKNNGGTVSVDGGSGGTLLLTKNGWKLYGKDIHGDTTLTISGSGVIDELRLYPKNAQMTTYTYDPLIGMTGQCDANNRIIYYEYDSLGRLLLIRDHDKNILKKNQYTYQEAQ